eukprot:TRINITY_DN34917_c0_g1_i1.p1 TRINITY_DN34917_c0_g1~~TRINITY_DN34917_c0_g1_i1.p1  ORF type:complete len:326 (-),score=53.22 TRINITY_DN34917_c0_g1_i1:155-1132(-)
MEISPLFFFFNDTATTEIYTLHIVGSVRCVQETGIYIYKLIYTNKYRLKILFYTMEAKSEGLTISSNIVGWIYCVAWSISFYGQIWENYKYKSVEGFKLDYVVFNFSGYTFYSIYNSFGYFDPTHSGVSDDEIQDLIFAYHGLFATIIQLFQCSIYPKGKNKLSKFCIIMSAILWSYMITFTMLTNVGHVFTPPLKLNSVNQLGYCKLVITLIKYAPQAYWNYKRKSTLGWSIFNVICDFLGGLFSFLQNLLDSLNGQSIFDGGLNIAKFCLAIISMVFDTVFLIQHYVLYNPKKRANQKQDSLMKTDTEAFQSSNSDNPQVYQP